jgi:hypothetical protein
MLAALELDGAVLAFTGPDEAAQEAAARLMAWGRRPGGRRLPLLSVNLEIAANAEESLAEVVDMALRDARLAGAVLLLKGWDALLAGEGAAASEALERVFAAGSVSILAGRSSWLPKGVARERRLFPIEFPLPSYERRLALWKYFTGPDLEGREAAGAGELAPGEAGLEALAGQFSLSSGQIRDAAASARDRAFSLGRQLALADLFHAARAHSNPRLSSLARKIQPRYGWSDLILPDDQLALLYELIATVRQRPRVLESWGLGNKLVSSQGVTVLFAGPPGTGKTMAAEVIAGELGLDLFKIDLSTVVSKYIGETEKNLERVFTEAASSNAILFFDEADALFGKRSEVRDSHDRYANIEISYLLQRMEAYDGVTILATNLRSNLDEAFTRRLQFAVDFPFPDQADRLRIWQALFPSGVPRAADLDLPLLAQRFKLAGGNIRNILVSAAYLAASDGGQVTMAHLLHGARRELQKMGRLVYDEDL